MSGRVPADTSMAFLQRPRTPGAPAGALNMEPERRKLPTFA
jgi:hypothetical protein